jgi:uncharacterized protein (DUF1697 family)
MPASWTSANVPRVIGLLRAVNVGGRVLRMEDLRTIMGRLGYAGSQTLLQSGNVVFGFAAGSKPQTAIEIEGCIERELQSRLALQSDVFVRSAGEWDDVMAANPFPAEAKADPGHLILMVLRDKPGAAAVKILQAGIKGRETVRAGRRHLYIVYPDGVGTSKLTGTVIERTLSTRGTARNWNTVVKLAALARA